MSSSSAYVASGGFVSISDKHLQHEIKHVGCKRKLFLEHMMTARCMRTGLDEVKISVL